jgi:hypothetical protein
MDLAEEKIELEKIVNKDLTKLETDALKQYYITSINKTEEITNKTKEEYDKNKISKYKRDQELDDLRVKAGKITENYVLNYLRRVPEYEELFKKAKKKVNINDPTNDWETIDLIFEDNPDLTAEIKSATKDVHPYFLFGVDKLIKDKEQFFIHTEPDGSIYLLKKDELFNLYKNKEILRFLEREHIIKKTKEGKTNDKIIEATLRPEWKWTSRKYTTETLDQDKKRLRSLGYDITDPKAYKNQEYKTVEVEDLKKHMIIPKYKYKKINNPYKRQMSKEDYENEYGDLNQYLKDYKELEVIKDSNIKDINKQLLIYYNEIAQIEDKINIMKETAQEKINDKLDYMNNNLLPDIDDIKETYIKKREDKTNKFKKYYQNKTPTKEAKIKFQEELNELEKEEALKIKIKEDAYKKNYDDAVNKINILLERQIKTKLRAINDITIIVDEFELLKDLVNKYKQNTNKFTITGLKNLLIENKDAKGEIKNIKSDIQNINFKEKQAFLKLKKNMTDNKNKKKAFDILKNNMLKKKQKRENKNIII